MRGCRGRRALSLSLSLSLSLAGAAVVGGGAPAQRPSSWQVEQAQTGVGSGAVTNLGKLVVLVDGAELAVFSSFTRAWHRAPLPGGASLRQANDWVLVRSGGSFTAFSAMRGTFEPLALSPAAQVVNPATQRNDSLLLVRDGGQLWAFSGFTGRWLPLAVSANAVVAVQRHTAILFDGGSLYGMSAFGGGWVRQATSGPAGPLVVDGTYGVAEAGGELWGFSAHRRSWVRTPAPASGAAQAAGEDVIAWADGVDCIGFSGLRGAFARIPQAGSPQLTADAHLVAAQVPGSVLFFSGATAQWTAVPDPFGASLQVSAATALLVEGAAVHAYSALRSAVSTLHAAPASAEVNWTVGAVYEAATGRAHFFSAFTGEWRSVPAPPTAALRTAFNGGLVEVAGGFAAFSARSGRFVPLAAAAGAVAHVDRNSGVLAVEQPGRLSAFEPRREVWVHAATAPGGGPLSVTIWRTSLLAVQGRTALGFGTQHGELEAVELPAAPTIEVASSEVAFAATSSVVAAFSAVPDLTTLSQFPEFRRVQPRGAPLELQLRAEPAVAAQIFLGAAAAAPLRLPVGEVLLQATGILVPLSPGVVGAEGRYVTAVPVPDLVVLRGVPVAFQAALLEPGGGAYLSRLCGAVVL